MARHRTEAGAITATATTALAIAALLAAGWAVDATRRRAEARRVHRQLVDLLLNALTADDPGTARHSRRVADLTDVLAEACGCLDPAQQTTLRVGALLHDMGKIDDRFFQIVHSRKPLSPEQRARIKHHPHQSAAILEPLEAMHPGIQDTVSSHHECWDGSGYPKGRSGDDIPLAARIIALADVFDALTQPRRYKEPRSVEDALRELRKGAGKQFDPTLVELIASDPVLSAWTAIAEEGQRDELHHMEHPNPTEAELEKVSN
jgi:putative nucleotidyltransferase with HDIG domain